MTLFVKTDKSVLQTINLEGQATSALLDTVEVTKAIRLGLANMQFDYETTPVTSNCCHDKTQLLPTWVKTMSGKIPLSDSQISLNILAGDVVTVKEHWQYLEEKNTYMSLWNMLTSFFITGSHPEIYQNLRIINNLFDWKITLDNVADFSI